ncbi:GntR family transcriptional regulator [Roseateles sp. UC29_93]|uniref:GntR family transcriptional regulator n=1 Tax=Roseateles sp. UC29_93 TaxID=3350177 RepID=UPI00366BDEA7
MVRSTHPINTPTYLRLRDQIRSDIEDGCWRLGQHLTLHELSAHYSVSNVPVREALLQLQGDGMVDMRMNKGAVVRAVDARFIDEYFDVREALQSMLLARACRTMGAGSAQTLSGVNALLGPLEDATRAGRVRELLAADEALQDHLGRLGGNDQALGMQASRGRLLEAFRRARVALWAPELEILAAQGRAMLQALMHADPAIASEAVRRHVAASRAYMLRMLKVPESPVPPTPPVPR